MKTKTQISTLFLVLSIMFATNTFAQKRDIKLEEETYIDDIPFNTEWVVADLMNPVADFEDESIIDDIPFNTSMIVAKYHIAEAAMVSFDIEGENTIDDLPFNTERVANNYYYNNAVAVDFELTDDVYVDDIPFNTLEIAKNNSQTASSTLLASGR